MKHRLFNKMKAKALGYFWLPCPLCGQYFGGHEWKRHGVFPSSIKMGDGILRKGICKDCTEKGLGDQYEYTYI